MVVAFVSIIAILISLSVMSERQTTVREEQRQERIKTFEKAVVTEIQNYKTPQEQYDEAWMKLADRILNDPNEPNEITN